MVENSSNNEEKISNAPKVIDYKEISNQEHWIDHDRNIKNYIPFEVIEICKNLFNKFSKGAETVPSEELINMLRLLDLNPSKKEIEEMLYNINPSTDPNSKKETIDINEFLVCVARKRRDSSSIHELMSAFKILDKNRSGKIPEPVLRFNLCKKGEIFTDEEMDAFMKESNQFIETIDDVKYLKYEDFALYLKDMYVPKEEVDPKKAKKKK